jgi:HSP20 family protein
MTLVDCCNGRIVKFIFKLLLQEPNHEHDRMEPIERNGNMLERYNLATGRSIDNSDTDFSIAECSPTVDIEEDDNSYLIRADVPGVDKKDIDVRLDNGVLSITGEKKVEKEIGKGSKQHRTERYCGPFSRRFTLPSTIKSDKVDASYKDGVLTLKVPKAEDAKPKSIEIKLH